MAETATEINRTVDNIGARRLHNILERVVEDISFAAPEKYAQHQAGGGEGSVKVVIDVADIDRAIGDLLKKSDLSRFVL